MTAWRTRALADEFYLIAHHDVTGRPKKPPRVVALGLAASLIAELMLDQRVDLTKDDAVIVTSRQPPADAVAHTVLDQLDAEQQRHPIRNWLAYLARDATRRVAGRLERDGVVRLQQERRFLRTDFRWEPTDSNRAAWPSTRLRILLERPQPLDFTDVFLTGLVEATGMTPEVLWGLDSRAFEYRDHLLAGFPAPWQVLLAQTKTAVGTTVLAHRN